MPLRDHFRPPNWTRSSWEGFHGMWPATIVQSLSNVLPEQYTAEPRVHLGSYFEIEVCAYETEETSIAKTSLAAGPVAVDSSSWAAPDPTLVVDADPAEQYHYEVLVYDQSRGRRLVAAIEIVSPANKDRPESRQAFVSKCAALLQKRVCVSIVDLITTRQFNLYCDLLDVFAQTDPTFAPTSPATYAATCRGRRIGQRPRFESWAYPLIIGQALPILPIWLAADLAVSLDLEASYEETCRALRLL